MTLDLSICVVLYRSEAGTRRFHRELLESLAGHSGWELRYYDNSPTDALKKDLVPAGSGSEVTYRHDPRNLGFSFANNQLLLNSTRSRVLLLNPDVYGFVGRDWEYIASADTRESARFARLLNEDGSFQDCVGEVSSVRRAVLPHKLKADVNQPTQVGMGIMAFMLTDKEVVARVGLLDCDYPLYAEDMDWCHRAAQHDVAIIFDPNIELTHTGGASASSRWDDRASRLRKYTAEAIFIDKHYRGPEWLIMWMLNRVKRLRVRMR